MEQASSYHIHIGLHAATVLALAKMITLWTLLSGTHPLDLTHEMLQEKLKIVRAMYKHVKVTTFCTHAILASLFLKTQVNADQV